MKNLFIVNPNAGMRQSKQHLPSILEIFSRHGEINNVHITSKRGEAVDFIAAHGEFYERIICMGGDGTLNEVITGILTNSLDLPIGYIPAGTANDVANSLDISKNMVQAAKNILNGEAHPIDIGKFGERYFSYIASFGAFTKVSYNTPQSSKNMLGHLAYIIEGLKELPNIRPEYIKITARDGGSLDTPNGEHIKNIEIEGEYIFGAVINSKSVGGGVLSISANNADMSDGLFEVMIIKPLKNPVEVWECAYSLISQNYNPDFITFFKSDSVTVHAKPALKWSLDGEREDSGDVVIENLRHAIKIIM